MIMKNRCSDTELGSLPLPHQQYEEQAEKPVAPGFFLRCFGCRFRACLDCQVVAGKSSRRHASAPLAASVRVDGSTGGSQQRRTWLIPRAKRTSLVPPPPPLSPLSPTLTRATCCPCIAAEDELVREFGARAAVGAQPDGPRQARGRYVLRPVHKVSVRLLLRCGSF